jgi:formamidopyrimidine-DNA glycosylase
MPEILEVELYRALAEKALGRTITNVWMVDSRYGRGGTTPRRLKSALLGHEFTEARRRGKLMLLDTDDGPTLGVRFGMTGGLVVDGAEALDRLIYGPGVFGDKWVRDRLGPDALSVTLPQLRQALASNPARASSSAPLKARLLDQERLAGVGNLLADEMLWRAGLDPGRRTPLTDPELRALHKALRATLRQLGRLGGSHTGHLMDERHSGGRCPKDGTELQVATVGGRTTWWCPHHQH